MEIFLKKGRNAAFGRCHARRCRNSIQRAGRVDAIPSLREPQNSLRSFWGPPTAAWIKKSESKCFRIFLKKDSETRASPTINFLWRFYKRRSGACGCFRRVFLFVGMLCRQFVWLPTSVSTNNWSRWIL